MKKAIALAAMLILCTAPSVQGEPKVACHIEKVMEHRLLVTFSWTLRVDTDKARDACDLTISFRDDKGREIYAVHDLLKMKAGANTFTGTEICGSEVWKNMSSYRTTLDCVF